MNPIQTSLTLTAIAITLSALPAWAAEPVKVAKAAPAKSAPAKGTATKAPAKTPAKAAKETPKATPTEIQLAHQLTDEQALGLQQLIAAFNEKNKDVIITPVRRSIETDPATLNLVVREDVARFVGKQGYQPLYQVMSQAKVAFKTNEFSADLKAGVTDPKGRYKALPLAYSTPVLFYNKALFKKANLDPDNPPKTWREVQQTAGALINAGVTCPYTTSHPAWIHIDNLAARHGLPVTDKSNKQLLFNSLLFVKHIALLSSWAKSDYMIYYGRGDAADKHFADGKCGMLTSSSYLATALKSSPGSNALDFGMTSLPYHEDISKTPSNTLADGASLWVGANLKPAQNKAAARFVSFLLTPENQVDFAHRGGFLPLTPAARDAIKGKLLADESANLNLAYTQLQGKGAINPFRVSQVGPLRIVVEEELEAVWDGRKTAKGALDTSVERDEAILKALPKNAIP